MQPGGGLRGATALFKACNAKSRFKRLLTAQPTTRREENDPDSADHAFADAIQHICLKHKYYGYRRVTATLRRQGHVVNAKRILRLMREDNLLAQRRKPFIVPPKGRPEDIIIVPNLVRGLVPSGPDQIWVADIT